ncbi:MAG: NDP-hexose 2,3-dehydratase family protein [Myxococcota bacterium]
MADYRAAVESRDRSSSAPASRPRPDRAIISWLIERSASQNHRVERVPLSALQGWSTKPGDGDLVHQSGRFFAIRGVRVDAGPQQWTQPIIVQPEVGLSGMVVRRFDSVMHCLVRAKMEPGNINYVQLSPTVQATRSNYTRAHRGSAVPYLEYFQDTDPRHVLVDALHTEQGSWFLAKNNRNMVVEVDRDIPVEEDHAWLSVSSLQSLLRSDDILNMSTRTLLACMGAAGFVERMPRGPQTSLSRPVHDSFLAQSGHHSLDRVRAWLDQRRKERAATSEVVPLRQITNEGWNLGAESIRHERGRYFQVVGIDVSATGREVRSWQQPIIAPTDTGLVAFVARRIDGLLHVLVQARVEAGAAAGAHIAPTVQCVPGNYEHLPADQRPRYLDVVREAPASRRHYDAMQSEEGGRLFHARNRYRVVEVDDGFSLDTPPDYQWVTLGQLDALLVPGGNLDIELRSLMACTRTLA